MEARSRLLPRDGPRKRHRKADAEAARGSETVPANVSSQRVLLEAICTIIPKPANARVKRETRKIGEREKIRIPSPKMKEARAIILPNPRRLFREAKKMAPIKAPKPEAAMRKPRVSESP